MKDFMLRNLLFLFAGVALAACTKQQKEGGQEAALVQKIAEQHTNCTCLPFLDKYSWRGQEVYMLAYKGPACNWTPAFFDRDGQPLALTAIRFDSFLQESRFIKTIWTYGGR